MLTILKLFKVKNLVGMESTKAVSYFTRVQMYAKQLF